MFINFNHLKTFFSALVNKMKGFRGNWNQNDPTADDYVKNRTHYEETTVVNEPLNITWDGNTAGLVSVAHFYKISDVVLTNEQIHLVSCTTIFDGTEQTDSISDMILLETEDIVSSYAAVFVRKDGAEFDGIVFPEAGIYVYYINEDTYVNRLVTLVPIELPKTVVHPLDEKFIPDIFVKKTDKDNDKVVLELELRNGGGTSPMSYREIMDALDSRGLNALEIVVTADFDTRFSRYYPVEVSLSEDGMTVYVLEYGTSKINVWSGYLQNIDGTPYVRWSYKTISL